jgi:crotonobetainyl-CoA:carnitine CoA-transferase CaiB-like acyl-CoA transferase
LLLAMGILAAYAHRLRTGRGQMVDTSLFEAGITHTYWQSAIAFATGVAPGPMGSAHPLNAPYQALRTRDGYIVVGANGPKLWKAMLDAIGASELASDPRFVDNGARMAHRAELEQALEAVYVTRTMAEWLAILDTAGVPAGPINDVKQMHDDPQANAREMIVTLEHPVAGRVETIGLPIKFGDTPGAVTAPSPVLGQHTEEVLREHGLDDDEIQRLAADGAILLGKP